MNLKNNELLVRASYQYPSLWATNLVNESGTKIEFKKRKFLIDIYNDLSPLQVWLKPPQIGATVCNTLKSFYVAKRFGRQIIYTLPTQGDVHDMVGGSINRIIAQNPVLMDWVKDHDTVEQKSIGNSIIFYRGTFTAKQAMMVPSGLNIHDEVDASDPQVITQYETRLQAQEDGGWRWYFSHPSLSGHGVDIYWQQSDKKEWFIVCPSCKERYTLDWEKNIDRKTREYICHHCKNVLPDEARINGSWQKTAEGEFSGYHVSQLMLYNKTAGDIIDAYEDPMKDKQYFYNYVLGLPYIGSDDKIPAEVVLKNCVNQVNEQKDKIIIGVDTGLPIHYTLLNKSGIFYYNTCKEPSETYDPYDDLRILLRRFKQSVLISDQGGDLIGIRKLQMEFPGRVMLCYYRKDKKNNEVIKWGEGEQYGIVAVDRNRMMQIMVEQFREPGRIILNGSREEWIDFAKHFDNIYREKIIIKEVKDKDDRSLYGNEYVWKRNGPDHWVHSTLYAMVGLQKYGNDMATILGEDVMGGLMKAPIIKEEGIILSDW